MQAADEKLLEHKMRLWRDGCLKLRGDCDFFTAVHESCHMVYYRDLGIEPDIQGGHWDDFQGERCWFGGGVSADLDGIDLQGDPVSVGKMWIGPRFLMLELRGEAEMKQILEETWFDLHTYNEWYCERFWLHQQFSHWTDPLPNDLAEQIEQSCRQDFNNPDWQRQVWETASEYAQRIDQQAAEEAKAKLDEVEKHGLGEQDKEKSESSPMSYAEFSGHQREQYFKDHAERISEQGR